MSDSTENAKRGKIARLPERIRNEVCQRLLDGQQGPEILPWLNGLAEVEKILAEDFEGICVGDQNLTAWRKTGYADWLKRRDRVERTKELTRYASAQATAGAGIAGGAASIAAGKLLEVLEDLQDGERIKPDEMMDMVSALTALRVTEQNDVRLKQNDRKLAQKDEQLALDREKFQRDTCKLFLKWHTEKTALDVANSDATNADKIERLGQLMFPDTWKPATK